MRRNAASGEAASSVEMHTAPHTDRHTRRREQTHRKLLDAARALLAHLCETASLASGSQGRR